MVIKLYISVISCSQEVKKNQQRAVMILESKSIPYVAIDITDPACEDSKDYMCETAIPKPNAKVPVTPQIFNEADYCGDFEGLDMANECDTIGDYLKLTETEKKTIKIGIMGIYGDPGSEKASEDSQISNGITTNQEEPLPDHEVPSAEVGEEQSPITDLAEDSSVAIKDSDGMELESERTDVNEIGDDAIVSEPADTMEVPNDEDQADQEEPETEVESSELKSQNIDDLSTAAVSEDVSEE